MFQWRVIISTFRLSREVGQLYFYNFRNSQRKPTSLHRLDLTAELEADTRGFTATR